MRAPGSPAAPVSLSSATAEQLDALPGRRPRDGAEDRRVPPGARAVHVGRRPRCDPGHRPGADRRPATGSSCREPRSACARARWQPLALGLAALEHRPPGIAPLRRARRCCGALRRRCSLPPRGAPRRRRSRCSRCVGWWWGGVRLDALDRSPLRSEVDRAARALVEVTGEPRVGAVRASGMSGRVLAASTARRSTSASQLELPLGRAPPQGALVERARGRAAAARARRTASTSAPGCAGKASTSSFTSTTGTSSAARGGLAGAGRPAAHAGCARASAPGLTGERRAVLEGVVLGDDNGLSPALQSELPALGALPPAGGLGSRTSSCSRRGCSGSRGRLGSAARVGARRRRSRRSARTCSRSGRSRP